ncbi:cilia- and flagella-associated protein 100 isoform X1 [Falco cherrug]|uniref:cilia- and flagella-associated protein 100 isoform X1 n=1 Tax=Falco cherrug TaxID=345164 RepID=UPI00247A63A3|nr:cilia- and flagella-associated protein 100 isoform X1 [Falco cherrug]
MVFPGPGSKMPSPHRESTPRSLSSKSGTQTQLVLSESPEEDEENSMKNPFTIPPDIRSIREEERRKVKAERERMKTRKIHEKITYSTKIKAKQKGFRKALQKEEEEVRKQVTNEERLKTLQQSLSWKMAFNKEYPLEKETFRDYINDRREIFLLEYAIAIKRDEIQRMEDIAKDEERKLEKAEYYLEKDAAMFDEFLKENHKNSVQALKINEKETTTKTKKIREIQMITSQIENLQSDIAKLKNTLQEYRTYRDFLYQLSPKEWQEKHRTKEKDLKAASKATEESTLPPTTAEQGECQGRAAPSSLGWSPRLGVHLFLPPGLTARTNAAALHSASYIDVPSSLLSSESLDFRSLPEIKPQHRNFLKPLLTRKLSPLEDAESETCSDEDELQGPELYFTDPQQLLSIFAEMEEENLSFIQNSKEIEESLDKIQHTFITTHESTEKKLAELKQQVAALKSSITKEEEKIAELELKVRLFYPRESETDVQDQILTSLNKKVLEVYCHCTGESEANLQTLQMLMVIEKQLYDLLDNLEKIPPEKLEQAQKAKKKEWRIRLREEKLRQQKQHQEEKLQRILDRSQATIKKKSDRRLGPRSNPPATKEEKNHSQEEMDKEKEEHLYYFT